MSDTIHCRNWEIEYRTEKGDWGMDYFDGSRQEALEACRSEGYIPIKIRPAD